MDHLRDELIDRLTSEFGSGTEVNGTWHWSLKTKTHSYLRVNVLVSASVQPDKPKLWIFDPRTGKHDVYELLISDPHHIAIGIEEVRLRRDRLA